MRMEIPNYKQMEHIPSMYHNIKQQIASSLEMVNMGKLLIIHDKNLMSKFMGKSYFC